MGAPKGNKYAVGNKGGAKPMYNTPEEMEQIIDDYFESCWDEVWEEVYNKEDRSWIWVQKFDRDGKPLMKLIERPTVTGLALVLGFTSRQALLNYQVKKEFVDTVKKAKLIVEHYYEKGVTEGDIHPATGIFILKNFEWKDVFEINTNKEPEVLNPDDVKAKLNEIKKLKG